MLNQSEPNLILTAHATKLNRPEPNWTEPQTCLAGRNHAWIYDYKLPYDEFVTIYDHQNTFRKYGHWCFFACLL